MRLYHATPSRNTRSILQRGILTAKARTDDRCIYLCTASRIGWARLHVAMRHDTNYVAVIAVDVPRSSLRRRKMRGIWASPADVAVSALVGRIELEQSP